MIASLCPLEANVLEAILKDIIICASQGKQWGRLVTNTTFTINMNSTTPSRGFVVWELLLAKIVRVLILLVQAW